MLCLHKAVVNRRLCEYLFMTVILGLLSLRLDAANIAFLVLESEIWWLARIHLLTLFGYDVFNVTAAFECLIFAVCLLLAFSDSSVIFDVSLDLFGFFWHTALKPWAGQFLLIALSITRIHDDTEIIDWISAMTSSMITAVSVFFAFQDSFMFVSW